MRGKDICISVTIFVYFHSKLCKRLEENLSIAERNEDPVEFRDFRYSNHLMSLLTYLNGCHLKAADLKNSLRKTQYAERNSNNLGGLELCCMPDTLQRFYGKYFCDF